MRTLTLQKFDSVVKKYGMQVVMGLLASLGIVFREKLISVISIAQPEILAEAIFWLSITTFSYYQPLDFI
jgi:hypothetical protein